MKRREMLISTGATLVGLSVFPSGWVAGADKKKQKVLYFTRSAGFEHSPVRRHGDQLSHSEKVLTELFTQRGIEIVCTKDGRVFDESLDSYDAIAFYTCGNLLQAKSKDGAPPMSAAGKENLLKAIAAGKGFVAFHSASDTFHSKGPRNQVQPAARRDPYIAMLGGEFIKHGPQQVATMQVTGKEFPGTQGLGDSFQLLEEWYALKNFAPDMHVILVQQTKGMKGNCYQRPPYPATWARMHGKGRVFYTSMGHREDVWTNETFQQIVLGGFSWAMGNVDAELAPNLNEVAPKAEVLSTEL